VTAIAQSEIEELFRSHRRDVFRLAYSLLGNAAEAEDVTQTTFLNALRSLRQGTHPRRPHAWLLAIAHNACRSQIRDRRRAPVLEELDESRIQAPEAEGPDAADIVAAMRALEPRQRAALVLHDTRGLSVDEVARRLGTSTVAAQSLVARARATLREELEAAEEAIDCRAACNLLARPAAGHERRLLRAHLRSCVPCRQEARRVRARRPRSALGAVFLRFGTLVKLGGAGAAAITGAVAVGVVGAPRDVRPSPARSVPPPARSVLPSAASLRAHAAPVLSLTPARHRTAPPQRHVVLLPVLGEPATPVPAAVPQTVAERTPTPPKASPGPAPAPAPAAQVPLDPPATPTLPATPALPVSVPAVTTPSLPDVSPPSLPLPPLPPLP
jgi:RNA polymerase sigma factor (sigma-70 family)